jgi:hypothetical protein
MSSKRIITPRHYQGIGEVIVTWARLETHLLQTLRALLGLTLNQAYVLFWEMGFSERSTRLRMLVKIKFRSKDDPIRNAFERLMNEIDDAYALRNIPAHSVWHGGTTPNAIVPLHIRTKKGRIRTTKDRLPTPKEREFSPERFRAEAIKISDLAARFKEFSTLHFGAEFLHDAADDGFD